MKRLLLAAMLVAGGASATDAPAKLPSLKIDPARVTVAGLSSGAYMATQAQVAYPDVFHGAALVAGGTTVALVAVGVVTGLGQHLSRLVG